MHWNIQMPHEVMVRCGVDLPHGFSSELRPHVVSYLGPGEIGRIDVFNNHKKHFEFLLFIPFDHIGDGLQECSRGNQRGRFVKLS